MLEQEDKKTNATTANLATISNALAMGGMTLIGVFGTVEEKHALLRAAGGKIHRVSVGDTVSQHRVVAIAQDAVILSGVTGQRKLSMPAATRRPKAAA